ncbi:hypothetical protein C8F04DRAFT_1318574 [Mycena alexandri]|uniref:Uncharacterized protein n=1 Tax=Mycena alexandri TaxID=1745969 RepID=A0AAD6S4A6_9AGAR|nr:hypothetical protein C8F04DRAFT_1318574 [Mycena alexandri]
MGESRAGTNQASCARWSDLGSEFDENLTAVTTVGFRVPNSDSDIAIAIAIGNEKGRRRQTGGMNHDQEKNTDSRVHSGYFGVRNLKNICGGNSDSKDREGGDVHFIPFTAVDVQFESESERGSPRGRGVLGVCKRYLCYMIADGSTRGRGEASGAPGNEAKSRWRRRYREWSRQRQQHAECGIGWMRAQHVFLPRRVTGAGSTRGEWGLRGADGQEFGGAGIPARNRRHVRSSLSRTKRALGWIFRRNIHGGEPKPRPGCGRSWASGLSTAYEGPKLEAAGTSTTHRSVISCCIIIMYCC